MSSTLRRLGWINGLIFAGSLVLPSTNAMAGTVEMLLIPCTPQMNPADCGLKLSVDKGGENATFTTNDGQVVVVEPGTTLSISGSGVMSQSTQAGPVVTFASAEGPATTASIGSDAGAGGGTDGIGPNGGQNNGGPPGPPRGSTTGPFTLTLGGLGTVSNPVSP